jgi:hypothetical protein
MKNKILIVITFLAGTLLFNSCLKDKLNSDWTSSLSGKMYAEFVNYGLTSFTITNLPGTQQIKVFVNIATDAVPTSDITLTVAVDAAALAAYNTANGTSFVVCPGITAPPIVIKAGTRNTYYYALLTGGENLNMTLSYAIPLTITAATGGVIPAANKQTTIIQVPVANKWEGSYNMNSYVLRTAPFDPLLSGNIKNVAWKLTTSGLKSVNYWKTHTWGDGKSAIGSMGPYKIVIDDSVIPNLITVTSPPIGDNAGSPSLKNRPGYPNRYDPTTKTFYIGVTWSTAGTREVTDTLVYTGKF